MNKIQSQSAFAKQIRVTEESVKNIYRDKHLILHCTKNEIFYSCNNHFSRHFCTYVSGLIISSIEFWACLVFVPDKIATFTFKIYDIRLRQP